uniref:Disease resistance protein At4g27190-like leucine-rich repeats domain-containing protein n=1 Tax=Vitis vinifera TaxID=29760 RepID=A5AS24_VITVI|nr:hypothetical protein VITISV_036149 [Vitis vinifera]
MDTRSQPTKVLDSVVTPAKDIRTGCPDAPSDGFVMGRGPWLVVVITCKTRFTLVNDPDNYIRMTYVDHPDEDPDEGDPDDNACHVSLIMHKVRELNRKKDVVCLILSYPPFNSRNIETHRGWIQHVLEINHKVREPIYNSKKVDVSELSYEITKLLRHSIHDIEAHIPSDIIVKMCQWWSPGHTTPKKAMLDLCIDDFMIRQILQYIQIPEIRRFLISQVNDKTFLHRLKNLPPIRQMFDLVIQVNVRNVGEVVNSSSIQKLAIHVFRQCSGHFLATVLIARALKEVKDVLIWQHASRNVISSLLQLEELSIDVNPEDERWNVTMKDIVKEICSLNRLHSLKLHLPEVLLLNDLRNGPSSSINLSCMCFRFIISRHQKCIISRLSHESAIKFEEQESCLKYLNGEGISTEIKEVLQHAFALFLDHHLTITSLSEFGIKNMKNLRFCVLRECNEIQTIVDAGDDRNELYNLEELVIEDCPEINNIVTHEVLAEDVGPWVWYLPKLKKISLHYMPKLVSISSNGVGIGPSLEWLSFYDCPSLKILSPEEVSSGKLKVIIGEAD